MPKNKNMKLPKNVRKVLAKEGKVLGNTLKNATLDYAKNAVSNPTSLATGGFAGSGFYRGMGAYRGSGGYSTEYNQLFDVSGIKTSMHVASANNETGNILIRKKEYLFDVFSPAVPAAFSTYRFQANPALGAIGPFVAQIASNYEKYRYRQLVFTYKPVVTDSSSTGQMGSVLLAFNSNAGAQAFTTKQQMAEYDGSMSVRVCDSAVLGVECDPRKGADSWLFIRNGNVPDNQDIKTYDFGTFSLATSGLSATAFPSGTQLGEIWVEYTVELAGPKLYDGMGYSILSDSFYGSLGLAAAYPLGTTVQRSGVNSLGGKITLTSGTRYTFPDNFQGWVRVMLYGQVAGTGTPTPTVTNSTIVTSGGIVAFTDMLSGALANINSVALNGTNAITVLNVSDYYVPFATSQGGNYLTLSFGTFAAGTTQTGWFKVDQINSQTGIMTGNGTNYVDN